MKFRYTAYGQAKNEQASPPIYRPVVPIVFRGARGSIVRLGLVDTGSDLTTAPTRIADAIGVPLPSQPTAHVTSIDGTPHEARAALVEVELRKGKQSVRFRSNVHFAGRDYVLLGTDGFLEFFVAAFDWQSKLLELKPHSCLVSP